MIKQYFEITTLIGCPVHCRKYCPQELITTRYEGPRLLSCSEFERLTATIPPDVHMTFAGFSEPFVNQETIKMIESAYRKGHKIRIYSTLVGMTPDVAMRIGNINIEQFVLHLPDALGNARIPMDDTYFSCLKLLLENVPNIEFMSMNGKFISNRCEVMAREPSSLKKKRGRLMCDFHEVPCYQMLPNGNVYFCCMTRGLTECVGNLNNVSYQDLMNEFATQSHRMQTSDSSLCRYCWQSIPYWKWAAIRLKDKVFGERRLFGLEATLD